ncbi:MAG: NAD(P)/FAD-dependent oxidoreductase [Silvibacterium sp.]
MSEQYDIAVVGSGFAGSLLAMIAQRLGQRVVLLERGRHPRVVIGESSTPLSNLLLEELTAHYDLPSIRPLSKWGSWQESRPELACGLKRGFSFFHHTLGRAGTIARENQLLVAASPHDRIADTHWYRADFDQFLVSEAQRLGVDYLDEVDLREFTEDGQQVCLTGTRNGREMKIAARFVVDATGPRGFLHHALKLGERPLPGFPATQALYSHFSGVRRLEDLGAIASEETPPYPIDDAAMHHVFEGGWVWVLRFSNGVTSAGVAATEEFAERLKFSDGAPAWDRVLQQVPVLREQFACAKAVQPFRHIVRLGFRSAAISGRNWALLPSAAGFIDPLLSTGFPLTLLGVARLAEILERDWGTENFGAQLKNYAAQTDAELLATSRLIAALYANLGNFPVFAALSLLYFAAASYSETARRLGKPQLASSFLLHDHPQFGTECTRVLEQAHLVRRGKNSDDLIEEIFRIIEPFDVAGLGDRTRRNWYPVEAEDLLRGACKVDASRDEIVQMLDRCGFKAAALQA